MMGRISIDYTQYNIVSTTKSQFVGLSLTDSFDPTYNLDYGASSHMINDNGKQHLSSNSTNSNTITMGTSDKLLVASVVPLIYTH